MVRREKRKKDKNLPLLRAARQRKSYVWMDDNEDGGDDSGDEGEIIDADEGVGAVADDADGSEGDGGAERARHGREHSEGALRGRRHHEATTTIRAVRIRNVLGDRGREQERRPRNEDHAP